MFVKRVFSLKLVCYRIQQIGFMHFIRYPMFLSVLLMLYTDNTQREKCSWLPYQIDGILLNPVLKFSNLIKLKIRGSDVVLRICGWRGCIIFSYVNNKSAGNIQFKSKSDKEVDTKSIRWIEKRIKLKAKAINHGNHLKVCYFYNIISKESLLFLCEYGKQRVHENWLFEIETFSFHWQLDVIRIWIEYSNIFFIVLPSADT